MEFATTQSFIKALEGVVESGVLENPVKADVEMMINLAYENGTINQDAIVGVLLFCMIFCCFCGCSDIFFKLFNFLFIQYKLNIMN